MGHTNVSHSSCHSCLHKIFFGTEEWEAFIFLSYLESTLIQNMLSKHCCCWTASSALLPLCSPVSLTWSVRFLKWKVTLDSYRSWSRNFLDGFTLKNLSLNFFSCHWKQVWLTYCCGKPLQSPSFFSLFSLVSIPNRILSLFFMCVCVCLVFICLFGLFVIVWGFYPWLLPHGYYFTNRILMKSVIFSRHSFNVTYLISLWHPLAVSAFLRLFIMSSFLKFIIHWQERKALWLWWWMKKT